LGGAERVAGADFAEPDFAAALVDLPGLVAMVRDSFWSVIVDSSCRAVSRA
jgi:hypothetical protein